MDVYSCHVTLYTRDMSKGSDQNRSFDSLFLIRFVLNPCEKKERRRRVLFQFVRMGTDIYGVKESKTVYTNFLRE